MLILHALRFYLKELIEKYRRLLLETIVLPNFKFLQTLRFGGPEINPPQEISALAHHKPNPTPDLIRSGVNVGLDLTLPIICPSNKCRYRTMVSLNQAEEISADPSSCPAAYWMISSRVNHHDDELLLSLVPKTWSIAMLRWDFTMAKDHGKRLGGLQLNFEGFDHEDNYENKDENMDKEHVCLSRQALKNLQTSVWRESERLEKELEEEALKMIRGDMTTG